MHSPPLPPHLGPTQQTPSVVWQQCSPHFLFSLSTRLSFSALDLLSQVHPWRHYSPSSVSGIRQRLAVSGRAALLLLLVLTTCFGNVRVVSILRFSLPGLRFWLSCLALVGLFVCPFQRSVLSNPRLGLWLTPSSVSLTIFYPLGCCPPFGLFAAAADAPLLDQRFCHCLAGPRFGNSSRCPRFLSFAKPRNTERILRWPARFTFHPSFWAITLLGFRILARDGSLPLRIGFLMEPLRINYYWPTSNCSPLFLVQVYPSAFLYLFHFYLCALTALA